MIKWKSLILFVITLSILLGMTSAGVIYGYNYVLEEFAKSHPEINMTPSTSTNYTPNYKVVKSMEEYRDSGYIIKVPPGYKVVKEKDEPGFRLFDQDNRWEIEVQPKLYRYEEQIQANRFIENPEGDYYILLQEVFNNTQDPILLFQKLIYLPSSATHIKNIKTPAFFGFYIVSEEGASRVEHYKLFDSNYWHNITVYIDDPDYPHWKIENIISTLENDETYDYNYIPEDEL